VSTQHTVVGAGGVNLNVLEYGNSSGPAIVFIHGWSQSYMCWLKQLESNLAKDFRLIALDLRGHGLSDAPLEQSAYTSSQFWADDVNVILQHFHLQKVILVGWSYGGLVISDFLRFYGEERVAGINFVGAAVKLNEAAIGPFIGPGFYEIFEAAVSNDLVASIDAMRTFLDGCFKKKLPREEYERILCFNMAVRPDVRGSIAARDLDNVDVLKTLNAPVLVTQGEEDTVVLPSMAHCILENCVSSEASWYEGVAHGPFIEDTGRFNRELAIFARRASL
jgi:non-heme chloroperoxidase